MHRFKPVYMWNAIAINHQKQAAQGNRGKNIYTVSYKWLNLFLTNQTLHRILVLVMCKLKRAGCPFCFTTPIPLPQGKFFSVNSLVSPSRGYDQKITIHTRNCKSVGQNGWGGRSEERCRLVNETQIPKLPMSPKSWSWKLAHLVLEKNKLQNSSLFILNLEVQLKPRAQPPAVSDEGGKGRDQPTQAGVDTSNRSLTAHLSKTAAEELPELPRCEPTTPLVTPLCCTSTSQCYPLQSLPLPIIRAIFNKTTNSQILPMPHRNKAGGTLISVSQSSSQGRVAWL